MTSENRPATFPRGTSSRERISLRAKAMLIGAIIGLLISLASGFLTYSLAKTYLTNQRESAARAQSFAHAQLVANALAGGLDPFDAMSSIPSPSVGYRTLLQVGDEWISSSAGISDQQLPVSVLRRVADAQPAVQRANFDDRISFFTVFPIELGSTSVIYVGVSQFSVLHETLTSISRALLLGIGISTMGGLFIGLWLSRRVMGPLRDISRTAHEISQGNLEARVMSPHEADLATIARSFNSMADDLQTRLEAESLFAARAAHELRSPLTAIKGAAEIVSARTDTLPEELGPTLAVLTDRISYFERLLQDLLTLGRQASGLESVNLTSRSPEPLFRAIAAHLGISQEIVHCDSRLDDVEVLVDVQALIQVIGNLARNAAVYASGVEAIHLVLENDSLVVHVDDSGPGFSDLEREDLIRPFRRGRLASGTEGAGLGLSIADGLLKSMGSNLHLATSPSGGARCTFVIPLSERDNS